MPRITKTDLQKKYFNLTKKKASNNWSMPVLKKKINLAEAEIAYELEEQEALSEQVTQDINPEFEAMLDSPDNDNIPIETYGPGDDESLQQDGRGGPREGAGRSNGQTDKRARCERLMQLEVPDLAIQQLLEGLNLALFVKTGIPFKHEQINKIALGLTLPLYYWFPSMQGRSDVFTLHFMALSNIGSAFKEHVADVKKFQLEKEQQNNGETTEENPAGQTTTTTKNTGRNKITRKKTGSKRSTK